MEKLARSQAQLEAENKELKAKLEEAMDVLEDMEKESEDKSQQVASREKTIQELLITLQLHEKQAKGDKSKDTVTDL